MEPSKSTLSIIVPVYFNEAALPRLFGELSNLERDLASRFDMGTELIFIDDGSEDGSLQKLLELKRQRPDTKIIKLTRNFGAVEASSLGFHYVTGDCFTVIAADLQDPPSQIAKMVEEWRGGCKFVLSRRKSRKDPWLSMLFSKIYYLTVHFFVFDNYPKGGFDLMLMDKQILPHLKSLTGTVNYQLFVYWLGFEPKILESDRAERKEGKSRWTLSKKINLFVNSITGFSVKPLRLFSLIGIFTSLLSFLYGSFVFVMALINQNRVPGFAAIYVLTSFFGGLIVSMLAIIGEYIWRIFELVNQKPTRVIDKEYLETPIVAD